MKQEQNNISVGAIRWLYLVIGIVMLLLLGLIYAWSVFVAPLEVEFGWSRSETSMTFSICMSMFCIGGVVSGFLSKRMPLRVSVWLCALLVLIGFFLASRIQSLAGLYITYGVFVGLGVGLAYNAVISTFVKWFPDKQGLASGLLLMGFGFGGMLLGTVCTQAISAIGWRATFRTLGIVMACIILLCSYFVRPPKENVVFPTGRSKRLADKESGQELSSKQMLIRPSFWMFYLWAVVLSAAGLMLIGHATPFALDLGVEAAQAAVLAGLISIFNGSGRVVMGIAYDLLGRKVTMLIISSIMILSSGVLLLSLITSSIPIMTAGFVLTGFAYGGIMPTNSSVVGRLYGMKNYSLNFSILNTCIIPASFGGPYLAGIVQTASGSYSGMAVVMIACGVVAIVVSLKLKPGN